MKDIKIGKHKLKIYDSIEELPIVRHHKFNKLMLIDAHIGSELSDFDNHLERIMRYIREGKSDLAEKELLILRQNVFFIQSEISPKYLAFAALIYSVDGKENKDLSDEALTKLIEKISDVPVRDINGVLEESKKKLDDELQAYFPRLFDSSSIKEYYEKLKKRSLLLIKQVSDELSESEEEELEALTTELILFIEPQVFAGSENLEIQQDKQFEDACLVISQSTGTNPKGFTVLEYYNALFFLKKQMKEQKRSRK